VRVKGKKTSLGQEEEKSVGGSESRDIEGRVKEGDGRGERCGKKKGRGDMMQSGNVEKARQ